MTQVATTQVIASSGRGSIASAPTLIVLAGIAVAVGLAAAYVLSELIASLLFGFVLRCSYCRWYGWTIIVVAAVACLLPAWRASRLDPFAALRVD